MSAENNPIGGGGGASSSSARGPWAFLVQDASTGVRSQLRIDEDTVSLFDMKGNRLAGKSYPWTVIKRWTAEQGNVFLFNAKNEKGEMADLRLHCDNA